jgi:hypothetical protein
VVTGRTMAWRPGIRAALTLPLWAMLLTSCSGGLQSVSGKVLYKGQPIKGAVVTFHPKAGDEMKTQRPGGVTGEDGTFSLSTGKEPGAAPGDYVVTIIWLKEPEGTAAKPKVIGTEPPPVPDDAFQGRYADRSRSQITATIKPGVNQLEPFKLE